MAVLGDLLFHRSDRVGLDDVLRHEVTLFQGKVDAIPEKLFSEKSDDEIVALIVKDATIEPLVVDFQAATAKVQETKIEVQNRFGFDVSGNGCKQVDQAVYRRPKRSPLSRLVSS